MKITRCFTASSRKKYPGLRPAVFIPEDTGGFPGRSPGWRIFCSTEPSRPLGVLNRFSSHRASGYSLLPEVVQSTMAAGRAVSAYSGGGRAGFSPASLFRLPLSSEGASTWKGPMIFDGAGRFKSNQAREGLSFFSCSRLLRSGTKAVRLNLLPGEYSAPGPDKNLCFYKPSRAQNLGQFRRSQYLLE